ncbi:MAG: hypothetical protein JWL62_3654 [Hyphomicrobiales bacterium]|nr:hypothetical protein [Hyphomicrobiales bacterium]
MTAGQLIADVLRDGKASAPVSVVIRDERDRTIASVEVVVSVSESLFEVI